MRWCNGWVLIGIAVLVLAVSGCTTVGGGMARPPKTLNGLPLVFHEEFEDGVEGWVMSDPGAWQTVVEDGNTVLSLFQKSDYGPPFRSPHSVALIDNFEVSDFVLEARLKQTGRDYGHRDMCIFLGFNNPSHYYYVHIATKADPHANSIFLVDGAARVSIAKERTDGTDWGREMYHTVRIERDTSTGRIAVYFDDMTTPIMVAEDKTFLTGGIGFGSFDDTGQVDDVVIYGKAVANPSHWSFD